MVNDSATPKAGPVTHDGAKQDPAAAEADTARAELITSGPNLADFDSILAHSQRVLRPMSICHHSFGTSALRRWGSSCVVLCADCAVRFLRSLTSGPPNIANPMRALPRLDLGLDKSRSTTP
jgi:hypothetical protein